MTRDWKAWVAQTAMTYNAILFLITTPTGIQAFLMPRRGMTH